MASPSVSVGVTHSRRLALERVNEVCLIPGECIPADAVSSAVILLSTGLLALLVAAAVVHLQSARSVIEEERKRTRAERDAFDTFARRITGIEVSGRQAPLTVSRSVTGVGAPPPDRGVEEVKEAYRDTVMAVDHYDEEYTESLAANMAAEFGEEIVSAVRGDGGLTPQLKGALVRNAEGARDRREEFLRALDREAEELTEASDALGGVEAALHHMDETPLARRSFGELAGVWRRLGDLETEVEEVLARRQRSIHEAAPAGRRMDGFTVQDYLYRPLPVGFPVLADGAALADRLRTARRRVLVALLGRP